MPVELRNIKGGGIHYVAYLITHTATMNHLKANYSEQVSGIAVVTMRDLSKIPGDLLTTIITTPLTMKEYINT